LRSLLDIAKSVLSEEAQALDAASQRLDDRFIDASKALASINGKIVCTGLGKSGHISRKIAATLASTGSPSFFLHPSEALHGDLGMISESDALLAIAYGGETTEVIEVARYAKRLGVPVVVITGKLDSSLASLASHVIDAGVAKEVCPHNLAPTTSSTLCLAIGDALSVVLMDIKGFKPENFAEFHPSGSLGRKMKTVGDLMRKDLTSIQGDLSFPEILEAMQIRNYGMVAICKSKVASGQVSGVITDGDLRRSVKTHREGVFNLKAEDIMTENPKAVPEDALAIEAVRIMEKHKNTALLVQAAGSSNLSNVVGVLRMHDLVEAKLI
jgi:arabinose-5-phosphate isomerase